MIVRGGPIPAPTSPNHSELEIWVSTDTHVDVRGVATVSQTAVIRLEEVSVAVVQTMVAIDAVADAGLHADEVIGTHALRRQIRVALVEALVHIGGINANGEQGSGDCGNDGFHDFVSRILLRTVEFLVTPFVALAVLIADAVPSSERKTYFTL